MKAETVVFTGIQKPLTFLGLHPYLLMITATSSMVVFGLCLVVGAPPLALPAMVAVAGGTWLFFYRRCRVDPHYPSFIFIVPGFWRQGKKTRILIAGSPPAKGGRR